MEIVFIGEYNLPGCLVIVEGAFNRGYPSGIRQSFEKGQDSRAMTQQRLAELCDYYPTVISKLENGRMSPTHQRFYLLCEALGYTTAQFGAFFDEEIALEKSSGKT